MAGCIISAHEHLGNGRLSYSNGSFAEYNAQHDDLEKDFRLLSRFMGRNVVGTVIYPQFPYRAYSTAQEFAVPAEEINDRFLELVRGWDTDISKYPFAYLRIKDPNSQSRKILEKHRDGIFGIKLHPDAEGANAEELLNSGILDLAQELCLPVTVHCSRPGGMMDFPAVCRTLLDPIGCRNVRLNIAHAGFLHPDAANCQLPDNVFMDISPLGIILDQYRLQGQPEGALRRMLDTTLAAHPNAVMYGADMPYNLQVWEDGSRHGIPRSDELELLRGALTQLPKEQVDAFYYGNACRFLFGEH